MLVRKRGGGIVASNSHETTLPDADVPMYRSAVQTIKHSFASGLRRLPLPGCLHHQFTLSGLNLERFLNIMQKADITLISARRLDARTLRCVCRTSDLERIAAVAQEKGWRLENAAPVGVGARLWQLIHRPGLVLGTLAAVVVLMVFLRFVWLIRIVDAGPYRADIAAYLSEQGYRPGIQKASVDAKTLTLLLQRRYPQVAWFRVYVNNVTLVVECTQGVPPPALPDGDPSHLIAARDGVVQSVQTYAGTALVRPGDLVRKGQVLIRGEERGADGEMIPTQARGKVVARCWQETSVRVSLTETISRETGRSLTQRQLCTPWRCWPESMERPEYLTYHLHCKETPVVGCFFPSWLREVEYREVELTNAQRPVEEAKAEAQAAAMAQLKQSLRGYVLLEPWLDTRIGQDGYVYATVTGEYLADVTVGEDGQPNAAPYAPVQ